MCQPRWVAAQLSSYFFPSFWQNISPGPEVEKRKIEKLWHFSNFNFLSIPPGPAATTPPGEDVKVAISGSGMYSMDRMVLDGGPFPQAPPSGPYFDPELKSNISVITNGEATLNCRVFNIGNRTVSQSVRFFYSCLRYFSGDFEVQRVKFKSAISILFFHLDCVWNVKCQ